MKRYPVAGSSKFRMAPCNSGLTVCLLLIPLLFIFSCNTMAQSNPPSLLLRLDDNGMNHSVTKAIEQVAATGILFSTSVMFACPWYQEAVDILKKYPAISVGVHLTLNSEWKYYRWGPVLGKTAVPSLVDSIGYFYHSTEEFLKSNYTLDEVEKELAAQIERALGSGLKIDYVDYHMHTAISTPALRAIVERLAHKYKLGISQYFGEEYSTLFSVSIENKKNELLKTLSSLSPGKTTLLVLHVAQATPEMNALIDMNSADMKAKAGEPIVAMHRSAELNALLSKEFLAMLKNKKIKLVTYRFLAETMGLDKMKAPVSN